MKAAATILLLASALAAKGKPAPPPPPAAAAVTVDAATAITQADALWAERVDPAKLTQALELYGAAHQADPKNRHVLERLTRGWYFLGDAHSTDKDTKIAQWKKAMDYGTACLALNPAYQGRVDGGEKAQDAVSSATKDDVPCIYWYATSLGKWGKIQGIAKALANLPTVKAFISRIEELDAQYFYFGPARYWGAYYAVLPSFAGQDLGKSGEYFDASIKGAPQYLPTRGLRAENLAPKTGNIDQFQADLAAILAFDVTSVPDIQPENTLEQAKARALLAKRGELFDQAVIDAWDAAHPTP